MFDAFKGVIGSPAQTAALWGMAASFVISVLIVITRKWHGSLSTDSVHGIQKFHTAPTPRVGGIAIVLGLVVAWAKAPNDAKTLITPILLAGIPMFLFGLTEDLTKRVGILARLLSTMTPGLLAWWLTDYSLGRIDVWGMDWLLGFTLVSVVFTAFAVSGVANSINIIDGFNGLASTMTSLAFMGYAMIAWQVGDTDLASVALVLAACVWGFFWVNWPLGKIFMGDGGSYFVGFALAWVAVLLTERNPTVSAFAALVVCAHPVTEVLLSIYRRYIKALHPGRPDRLHFHSMVKQRYVRRWMSHGSSRMKNSITGLLVGMMTVLAVVVANLVYASVWLSAAAYVALALGYVSIYARMVRHRWCSPMAFLFRRPALKLLRP